MTINFIARKFDGNSSIPSYVTNKECYAIIGKTETGYDISLGRLTLGESASAGKTLYHALYESYDDHGHRMSMVRGRSSGPMGKTNAALSAMAGTGVTLADVTVTNFLEVLNQLGEWFLKHNSELKSYDIVSQS